MKKENNTKKPNRRLLTFFRMFKYGFDSFIRNSWLSVAATAVMTITLLIIFVTFVSQNVLNDTVAQLRSKVDMSIYLKTETTDDDANKVIAELKKLSSVRSVSYVSADAARAQIVDANKDDNSVLDAIKEATNKNPATMRVIVNDINDTTQLQNFVDNNTILKGHLSTDYPPSFAGERRNTIQSIGRAVDFAQKAGIAAGSVFMIISALIIFNTIRMAIFNRREEIQMMKLIGANQAFIRGPFLVEATIYGIIASLIAAGAGTWALFSSASLLTSYQISVQPTINLIIQDGFLMVVIMILIGSIIGIVSSLFATLKHLKI